MTPRSSVAQSATSSSSFFDNHSFDAAPTSENGDVIRALVAKNAMTVDALGVFESPVTGLAELGNHGSHTFPSFFINSAA